MSRSFNLPGLLHRRLLYHRSRMVGESGDICRPTEERRRELWQADGLSGASTRVSYRKAACGMDMALVVRQHRNSTLADCPASFSTAQNGGDVECQFNIRPTASVADVELCSRAPKAYAASRGGNFNGHPAAVSVVVSGDQQSARISRESKPMAYHRRLLAFAGSSPAVPTNFPTEGMGLRCLGLPLEARYETISARLGGESFENNQSTMTDTLEPPRWRGGPWICLKENTPAFTSKKELTAFHSAYSPGSRIVRVWKCDFCQCYHYTAKPRPPSGDSSGTGRR